MLLGMFIRSEWGFRTDKGVPTILASPYNIYTIFIFSSLLWGVAFTLLFTDTPTSSDGYSLNKRYEGVSDAFQEATNNGPFRGLVAMDWVLMCV
jgi:hypothetical protein